MTHLAGQRRLPLKQKSCFNTSGKANYHGMNPFLMTLVKDGQASLLTSLSCQNSQYQDPISGRDMMPVTCLCFQMLV